jgi:hypothetical protein
VGRWLGGLLGLIVGLELVAGLSVDAGLSDGLLGLMVGLNDGAEGLIVGPAESAPTGTPKHSKLL